MLGLYAQTACLWEATARKPGNVHRFADFDDCTYLDFVLSAAAIGPAFDAAPHQSVGQTVLEGMRLTRQLVHTNTNLGMLLLFAPLAKVDGTSNLRTGVSGILDGLDVHDAECVYEAIRLAAPSGLGRVAEQDVSDRPTQSLRDVMALAADRDLIARQYASGFHDVFEDGVHALQEGITKTATLEGAILLCHVSLMAAHPDSLIRRKCGDAVAAEARRRARSVLEAGWPRQQAGRAALAELDAWLRADGHRRNPGTTADLVAASLFVALREGIITLPPQLPWSAGYEHG